MTFDAVFVVRNMKIVQGTKGLILCMPSRKMPDGNFKDVAHPISQEFRKVLEDKVMGAYQEELKKTGGQLPPAGAGDGGEHHDEHEAHDEASSRQDRPKGGA